MRFAFIATLAAAAAIAMPQWRDDNKVNVEVDGKEITFVGGPPQMQQDRVMVPIRGVFEEMNAVVMWDHIREKVTAVRGDDRVELWIGRNTALVNGTQVSMSTPAMIDNGRTYVPLRFVSESLGARVLWEPGTRKVIIISTE